MDIKDSVSEQDYNWIIGQSSQQRCFGPTYQMSCNIKSYWEFPPNVEWTDEQAVNGCDNHH